MPRLASRRKRSNCRFRDIQPNRYCLTGHSEYYADPSPFCRPLSVFPRPRPFLPRLASGVEYGLIDFYICSRGFRESHIAQNQWAVARHRRRSRLPASLRLRDDLGQNNPRFGCGLGQCGACTVLVDNRAMRSCMLPVSASRGQRDRHARRSGHRETPHPVQQRSSTSKFSSAAIA